MTLEVCSMQVDDIEAVAALISRSFSEFVAPTLSDEGIATFRAGMSKNKILKSLNSGNVFLVCKTNAVIVGVTELRNNNHLNLLFVDVKNQRKGIGKMLFHSLSKKVFEKEITVNASLNAIEAYQQFGFIKNGVESEVRGIRYLPMIYRRK